MKDQLYLGKKLKQRKTLVVSGVAILLIISCLCIIGMAAFLLSGLTVSTGGIKIPRIIVTDDPTQLVSKTTFPPNTKIIYGIVYVEAQQPVPIKIRWRYLDKDVLIYEDVRKIEKRGEWYILAPKTGEFIPGKYRFEIVLVDDPVEVVDFEIK